MAPWVSWRRKRFWLLVGLLLWTLLGFFAAPHILESSLTEAMQETGRDVDISEIRVNPFALTLEIDGLEVRDDDQTAIIHFDSLRVNFQLSSIFRRAWTFSEIRFDGLHLEEERFEQGETRLQLLARSFEAEGGPLVELEAPPTNPPRVVIHELTLSNGGIGVTDHQAGGFNGTFGPVTVHINDLQTIPDQAGTQRVSIATPSGGLISWSGDLQLVPLRSDGHLSVRGKGLPATLRYLDHFLPVTIEGEEVEVDFDYQLSLEGEDLKVSIDNAVSRSGDIHVYLTDADQPFLSIPEVHVAGGSLRWPDREISAESLTILGLALSVVQQEHGGLNLERVIDKDDEDSGIPAPWAISVENLNLSEASLAFVDETLESPGEVLAENINLELSGVDNLDGTVMPGQVSLQLSRGGALNWNGTVQGLPALVTDGSLRLSGLALSQAQPWLQEIARVDLQSGQVELEASVRASTENEGALALMMSGNASLSDFELQDTLRERRLAAVDTLTIERFEYDHAGRTLKTSPIVLNQPYGRIHIYEDKSTNLSNLAIAPDDEPAGSDSAPTPAPLSITIAGLEVNDAALDFADDSLPLPFSTSVQSMNGEFSALSSQSTEPAAVNLEGRVNEFGQARIEGALNAWDFTNNSDINMAFRNLDMARLSPYTIQFAGYAIDSGRLDVDLAYQLKDRRLESENNIVIRELQLGDKVEHPDAANLPLKLGVALLKDSEGVIDIDLPVSGNLDDPEFRVSGIVWKAIGNLLTRIVSSPFRLLGNLVGFDSEDFGTLAFQAGSAALSPPDEEQLNKLVDAMQQRPELSIIVNGVFAAALDRPALQEIGFEAEFEIVRSEVLAAAGEDVLDVERQALEQLFAFVFPGEDLQGIVDKHKPTPSAESREDGAVVALDETAYLAEIRQRLIEAQEVSDEALIELAGARAEAVMEYLKAKSQGTATNFSLGETSRIEGLANGQVPLELKVEAG